MRSIFVCYRREDSQSITDRIFDHLARRFSRKVLFKDVDNIPPGVDYRTYIENAVKQSSVMLAVIGPDWLSLKNATGQRRIDDPDDSVQIELSSALRLQRVIIPLLVGRAQMPTTHALPPALKPLAYINCLSVRSDPDFVGDIARLLRALDFVDQRWYSGWITRTAVVVVLLAAVGAILWFAIGPKPSPPSPPPPTGVVQPPHKSDAPPPAPPSPNQSGCVDVPFTDSTKMPPVTTTKRICS
jgi:TIR domain